MHQRNYIREMVSNTKRLSMTLIPFQTKEIIDVSVDLVDQCPGGVGISSGSRLEPGFIEVRGLPDGDRKGVVAWTKGNGNSTFRGGIQFVSSHVSAGKRAAEAAFTLPEFQHPGLVASMLVDEIVYISEGEKRDS